MARRANLTNLLPSCRCILTILRSTHVFSIAKAERNIVIAVVLGTFILFPYASFSYGNSGSVFRHSKLNGSLRFDK